MSHPRVLVVVDDDSKVRLLLERAFRPPAFEAHSFPTGAAALERIRALRPDCVVSDLLMPDMDGEALLRAVRVLPGLESVPFILVSAVRSEARIQSALAAGADAFLLKPFPLRDLIDKVGALLDRPAAPPAPPPASLPPLPASGLTGDIAAPTRPVVAAAHTTTTPMARRESQPDRPPRVVPPPQREPDHHEDLHPTEAAPGFGRFTRVESRGRSFVVLTEAVAQPRFTITTVITEKGVPLRKVESALPHPLAREDDRATIRRQLDLQHDDTLARLDHLVLEQTPRRVVWSDQSRSVDPNLLAWAVSVVAQLAEAEVGTDETTRQLRLTREAILVSEDTLRAFDVTSSGRVVVGPAQAGRLPRRAVRALALWCHDFAHAAIGEEGRSIVEPVRQATRRHALELERLGFYDRLARRAKA